MAERDGSIKSFRDLQAWQSAKRLAVAVYHELRTVPRRELFTTVVQMRRSSESVPNNIAEGYGLGTRPGFLKHLRIARGSLCELDTQREIAFELGLMTRAQEADALLGQTARLLQGLINSLERSKSAPPEDRRGS